MKIRYVCRMFLTMAMMGGAVFAVGQSSRPLSAVELQERGLLNGPPQDSAVVPETVAATDSKQTADAAVQTEAAAKQESTSQDSAMQPGDSHVRIVRLSEMRGEVWMDRKTGQGFEQTMQNMPIVEGMKLRTKAGTAEVEFEDGSTLRAAPDTVIEFPQLVRRGAGGTVTGVKLVQGMMYVNLSGTKGNSFTMKAGTSEMTVEPATHARLDISGAKTLLAVFNGGVEVQAASEPTVVGKKQTLTLLNGANEGDVAKNVEKGLYDAWDKELNEYHERNMRGNSFASSSSGYGYGAADLNYYGSFANIDGCGQVWQPYFTSAGWSPYGNGLWAAYPGAGYSWVSPYPWGWLPYHSGQWINCGGAGWGWQPGGGFVGLNNIAGNGGLPVRTLGGKAPSSTLPIAPRPPQPGGASLVVQTHGQIVTSGVQGEGFVFQKNSAGMGVPRGELEDLHGISRDVQRHGMMSMPVDAQAMVRGKSVEGSHGEVARGPVNLRPAGSTEVGRGGTYRGGNDGTRGGGTNGSAGPSSHSGNYGAGMGGGNRGGGAPPPPPSAPPAAAPAAAGHTGK